MQGVFVFILLTLINLAEPIPSQVIITKFASVSTKNATPQYRRMPDVPPSSNASMTSWTCIGTDSIRCAASCARDPACSGFEKEMPNRSVTGPAANVRSCMSGWKEQAGVCYKVTPGAFNWTSGDRHCKDVGGSLAAFNGDVIKFLLNIFSELLSNDTPVWIAKPANQDGCFYVGKAGGAFSTKPCEEEHRVVCQIPL